MRVMFVDDEPQVLNGLVRMLEAADVEWDVETATSGPEALEAMEEEPVDVLVSDMQMPGMDGAQLLDEVSRRYPNTVRMILTGRVQKDDVLRAVGPMHQYIAKPCKAEYLRDTISRACSVRHMLDSTKNNDFLGRISSLPSIPSLYQKVVEEIESEDGTVARVGELVEQDPAMTAKILQLANSAMFGLRWTIKSPAHAAALMGLDTLKSLILTLQVFKSFGGASVDGFSIDALAEHSFRVASIARSIVKCEGLSKDFGSEAFTAGLLHDVGKLVLAANAPSAFAAAYAASQSDGLPLVEAELAEFGVGHDVIGGYLLALWGLPQSLVEAVVFHHRPELCVGSELSVAAIVYFANCFAHETETEAPNQLPGPCDALVFRLGVAERIDVWRDAILSQANEV